MFSGMEETDLAFAGIAEQARLFAAQPGNDLPPVPRFNVCPTTQVAVVTSDGGARRLAAMGTTHPWTVTEVRPEREQPYYHLLAENGESSYVAYVSQQNLIEDGDGGPVDHPSVAELFEDFAEGRRAFAERRPPVFRGR